MSKDDEGRILTEVVLQQVINETEHEIGQLWKIVSDNLREIEEEKLKVKLDAAKKALKWVKGKG